MMCNNPSLDLIYVNAKFGKILSIFPEDTERKRNYDHERNYGRTDGRMDDGQNDGLTKTNITPTFSKRYYKHAILLDVCFDAEMVSWSCDITCSIN